MKFVKFLSRQMRHIKEGNKYISIITAAGTFIGVIGLYVDASLIVWVMGGLAIIFIPWTIGISSKKSKAKSERMSAEYRDIEYFDTLEKNVKKILDEVNK